MSSMLYVPFWFVQLYLLIALIMHIVVCNYVVQFTRSGLWDGLTTRPLLVEFATRMVRAELLAPSGYRY